MRSLKQSINQYRNIKGHYFVMYTADGADFPVIIAQCKELKVAYRVIENQLFIREDQLILLIK
jgi:hypothetical protein